MNIAYYFTLAFLDKDHESMKALNKDWYDWLVRYYHPLSIPTSLFEIPFYDDYAYSKCKIAYSYILKKWAFEYDYTDYGIDIQSIYAKGVPTLPCLLYKLPKNYIQLIIKDGKSNIPIPKDLMDKFAKRFNQDVYYIGFKGKDEFKLYQFIYPHEWINKKTDVDFKTRLIQTRDLVGDEYTLRGIYMTKVIDKRSYLFGDDFFNMKIYRR